VASLASKLSGTLVIADAGLPLSSQHEGLFQEGTPTLRGT
jgi:hypothetical protein